MLFRLLALCLFSFSASAQISGRVTLLGDPLYPDAVVQGVSDKHCLKNGAIKTEDWKISPDRGLGDVVISVENPPAGATASGVKKIEINQEGCRYVPHVSALQAGGMATVKNGDDTLHNVRGMIYQGKGRPSKPLFNIGQPIKGMKLEQKFPDAGIFRLNCDVHPWMESWILVLPHPFFAVTDVDGKFTLPAGLPDGDYVLTAWHSRFKLPTTQKCTISGGVAEVNVSLDAKLAQ